MGGNLWNIVTALAGALLIALLALAGTGMSSTNFFGMGQSLALPTLVVVAVAATTGGAIGASLTLRTAPQSRLRDLAYPSLLSVTCAAVGLLLIAAASRGEPSGYRSAVALLFAIGALIAGIRCIDLLGKGYPLGFESYWGGLGGGGGGWKVLAPTGLFILALSFGAASLALLSTARGPDLSKTTSAGAGAGSSPNRPAPDSIASPPANQTAPPQNTVAQTPSDNAAQ